jgi:NADH-quinone oxidoreductase subunit M
MGPFVEERILSCVIFLPILAGMLLVGSGLLLRVLFGSAGLPGVVWRAAAVGASGLTFLITLVGVWGEFDPERIGLQLVEYSPWLPEYGVHYFVAVDGISLFLVLLTTGLVPIVLIASWHQVDRSPRSFVFFILALESGMLGSFLSLNLVQFYFFWEVMLIPMYFIIGIWGGSRRIYAATKFFVFTMFGSLLMLIAILVLYRLNFEQGGAWNLDLIALPGSSAFALLDTRVPLGGEGVPWWSTQIWLFGAFALAFAIKVPLVPLHTWLPDAHVEAPTAGSVLLAAILLKMGTYGFLRFALPLFPNASALLAPLFITLALVGIVYGSLVAMVQQDIKKLVAYSSLAHLGFVVLGIFSLNVHGLTGSIVQMLNHGLSTGALFLLVGFLYERRHTHEISAFGGLAKPMPVFASVFAIVVMSSIGVPALNGFVGEFLVLLGSFERNSFAAVVACLGIVLSAAYMLSMYRRVMLGPVENPENRGLIDLDWRERSIFVALLIPIFWIGLYPNPVLRRIEPSVLELLRQIDERTIVPPSVITEPSPEDGTPDGPPIRQPAPVPIPRPRPEAKLI